MAASAVARSPDWMYQTRSAFAKEIMTTAKTTTAMMARAVKSTRGRRRTGRPASSGPTVADGPFFVDAAGALGVRLLDRPRPDGCRLSRFSRTNGPFAWGSMRLHSRR